MKLVNTGITRLYQLSIYLQYRISTTLCIALIVPIATNVVMLITMVMDLGASTNKDMLLPAIFPDVVKDSASSIKYLLINTIYS